MTVANVTNTSLDTTMRTFEKSFLVTLVETAVYIHYSPLNVCNGTVVL